MLPHEYWVPLILLRHISQRGLVLGFAVLLVRLALLPPYLFMGITPLLLVKLPV